MIGSLPYQRWASLALAVGTLALACRPAGEARGVPLYPNSETMRLPRSHVAEVVGSIAKVDGRDLLDQGGWFELLPGCHIVELDRRLSSEGFALSSRFFVNGQLASTTYAIRMKAGASYVIRRLIYTDGLGRARVALSAREEEASRAATDLAPAKSAADIDACRARETRLL